MFTRNQVYTITNERRSSVEIWAEDADEPLMELTPAAAEDLASAISIAASHIRALNINDTRKSSL